MFRYRLMTGSWMIGSWAFTCCACSAPTCTSCCCEMPQAVDIPTTAAIAAPATNRLMCRIPWLGGNGRRKGKTYSRMKILTQARDLRRRKARERHGLFVAEGVRAVEELLRSPLEATGALIGPQLSDNPR